MTDTNWRTMPAGPALDRVVADRLGWTSIELVDGWFENRWTEGDEEYLEGIPPNGNTGYPVPCFSTDAAAPLPLEPDTWFCLYEYTDRFEGSIEGWAISPSDVETMKADTLALARLRAWLARSDVVIAANQKQDEQTSSADARRKQAKSEEREE